MCEVRAGTTGPVPITGGPEGLVSTRLTEGLKNPVHRGVERTPVKGGVGNSLSFCFVQLIAPLDKFPGACDTLFSSRSER